MAWTFEEGLRFQCARDLMTDMIGICNAMIADEMEKVNQDFTLIEKLQAERFVFVQRRESFHVSDAEEIQYLFDEFNDVAHRHFLALE